MARPQEVNPGVTTTDESTPAKKMRPGEANVSKMVTLLQDRQPWEYVSHGVDPTYSTLSVTGTKLKKFVVIKNVADGDEITVGVGEADKYGGVKIPSLRKSVVSKKSKTEEKAETIEAFESAFDESDNLDPSQETEQEPKDDDPLSFLDEQDSSTS